MENRRKRLAECIETLSVEQMKTVIIETTNFCIDAEMVSFYDSYKKPIWSNSGDTLDGTEFEVI